MKKRFGLIKINPLEARGQREIYVPFTDGDLEESRKLKYGDEVVASCKTSDLRNLGHHRKLFALIRLVYQNLPEHLDGVFISEYELLTELKMQAGWREKRVSMGGTEYWYPKSIAFEKMGQQAFNEFYDRVVDVVCKYILPETTSKELEAEIAGFM